MAVEGCLLSPTTRQGGKFAAQNPVPRELVLNEERPTRGWCACAERSPIFWKDLNAKSATEILATKAPGSYILRKSEHPRYEYTLSERISNHTIHIRIGCDAETGLYSMDGFPASSQVGFTCVVNLVAAWSRVHRKVGLPSIQRPLRQAVGVEDSSYVNVETDSVCFHDDREAEERLKSFVSDFLKKRSAK